MGYIYLASPYSAGGAGPFLRELRYLQTMEHLAWMLRQGVHVYSPIVHCHELAKIADLPKNAPFWQAYNFTMLAGADMMHILMLEGWEHSDGIRDEALECLRLGKEIAQVVPCK